MNISKIAVANFTDSERTFLSKSLSCASGYRFIQNRNIYEWLRLYQIDESEICGFENQFLLAVSSFIERINSEFQNSAFISNGAVFSEALSLKFKMNEKSVELNNSKETAIIENILNITGKYAARNYDLVIHVQNADSTNFDELSVSFYDKYHIPYKLYDGKKNINDILKNIAQEVEIPVVQSLESAIYETAGLVKFKN